MTTPAIVQHTSTNAFGGTATALTLAFTTATQNAGDLIVAIIVWTDQTNTLSNVTDSVGNTYVRAIQFLDNVGVPATWEYWYARNIAATATTNTVMWTFSGAPATPHGWLAEVSGCDTNNPLGTTATSPGTTTGTALSTAAVTLGVQSSIGIAAFIAANAVTVGSGWTGLDSPAAGAQDEYEVFSATGSAQATATQSPTGVWSGVTAYFYTAQVGSRSFQGRNPRKRYAQLQAFPPAGGAPPVILTPATQLPITDVAAPRILVGSSLPASGRILVPIETPLLTTPLPATLNGNALPASAAIVMAAATLPPPSDPAAMTRGVPLTPPLSGSVAAADAPRMPTDPARLLVGGTLPSAGAGPSPPSTVPPPTDPAALLRGAALPATGARPQPPSTLAPPTDPGAVLRAGALPSGGAQPTPPATTPPPTDPATLVVGAALPVSGARPVFPGAPSLPTDPATVLRGTALPSSARPLVPPATDPPPAFPTAVLLRGVALPTSARVIAPPPTEPPPAFPTAALLRGFSPVAIQPGSILFPRHSDPPPTVPAVVLVGTPLAPSGQARLVAATEMAPVLPPAVLFGAALPVFATLRVGPETRPPSTDPAVRLSGAALPAAATRSVAAETRPPPTDPGSIRASPLPSAGAIRVPPPTDPPFAPLGAVLRALPPPAPPAVIPLAMAPPAAPQDPGARFLQGARPPPGTGLLLMAATELAERAFTPTVLYRSQVLLGGAFARPQVNVWPLADMRIQTVRSLPTVGDMRAMVCRIVQPGTFTPIEPDGSALVAVAQPPTGAPVALVVTRVSVGVYWAALTLTAPGDWFVRFTGTLNGLALFAETQLYCQSPGF